jgi:hypothetical protein
LDFKPMRQLIATVKGLWGIGWQSRRMRRASEVSAQPEELALEPYFAPF